MNKIFAKGMKLAAIAGICLGSFSAVHADGGDVMPGIDYSKSESLTVVMEYNEGTSTTLIDGAEIEIIRAASVSVDSNGSVAYSLLSDFAGNNINFDGMTVAESMKAAEALSKTVDTKKLNMTSVVTGADGKAVFTDLKAGMYLVREGNKTGNAVSYTSFKPYLVMVPGVKDGQWVYDVTAYPKTEITAKPTPNQPSPTPEQPTVPPVSPSPTPVPPVSPSPTPVPPTPTPEKSTNTGVQNKTALWTGVAAAAIAVVVIAGIAGKKKED
jgi:hypothetical protein